MVSEKRRRELARAKWERQQSRRAASYRRARRLRIVGGVVAGLVAVVLVGLGVRSLLGSSAQAPAFPTENTLTLKTPPAGQTVTSFSTGSPATGPTATTGTPNGSLATTPATTPTLPVTTGTTGSGSP